MVALYSIGGKMNKYKSTLKDANLTEFMVETARLGSFICYFLHLKISTENLNPNKVPFK